MGKKSNNAIVNYDTILDHIGQFGPWQQRIHFLLWLTSAAGGLAVVVYSFTAFKTPYICKPPRCESDEITYNGTAKAFVSAETGLAIPRIENNVCQYVALQLDSNPSQTEEMSCNEYIKRTIEVFNSNNYQITTCEKSDLLYDDTYVTSSLIQDYGFTCQHEDLRVIYAASYMLGMLFGSFFIGQISDRYGRMPALMLGLILVSGSGFLGAFMNDMHGYGFFRFLTGIGGIACFMVTFVICVEYVGVKYTMLTGIAIEIPFALGEIVLGIEAYLVRDWFTLQIVAYAPLIALLVLWFLIPESPRWLLAKGRIEEAKNILTKGAKINKKSLPDELFKPSVDSSNTSNNDEIDMKKPTLLDLFRPNIILKRTLNMGFQWFSVTMCYYGLSFAATDLLGDPYTNALLSYAIEIPGYVFCIIVMDRWGRRPILSFCQILSGISCIGAGLMFLDDSPEGAIFQTFLSLLGKFNAAACFAIVYVYTAELFPTVIRNTAVGTCSTIARVGGICSILIGYIPSSLAIMVIMGVVASVAGTLAIFLPETLGNPLPETMEDATNIGKDSKRGFCTCTSPPK